MATSTKTLGELLALFTESIFPNLGYKVDSDVESRYKLDATNTAKLMKLMAAHDGSSLLNAIKTRFSQYHADAHGRLTQYCDSHDIIYKGTIY